MTAEQLAFDSGLGSKGFLSDIEHGLAMPSISTLRVIAEHLDVLLLDLFTFPIDGEREALIDRTRWLAVGALRRLLRDLPTGPSAAKDLGGPVEDERYLRARRVPALKVAEKTVRSEGEPGRKLRT